MGKEKYKRRSDGRYYARVGTGKYSDDGKQIMKYIYGKTSKEVEKKINDLKYEIEHGTLITDDNITFGAYAKKWFDVTKANKGIRTKDMYRNIIRNHISYLENKKLSSVNRSDIQMQINSEKDKRRICELILITVKQIFELALDDGLVNKNPCKNITLPRKVVNEKRALTDMEKNAIKNIELTLREKAFIYIAYGCGLRPGEIYALTKADIDLEKCELTVNKAITFDGKHPTVVYPKTNSGIRTIQAPIFVFKAISEYIDSINTLILFCNENGEYMTRSAYSNIFAQIKNKINAYCNKNKLAEAISPLTLYIFRHNYCTELYYSGISMKEAQRLMGHADYGMIMKVYSHLDEKKENTKDKLEKLAL